MPLKRVRKWLLLQDLRILKVDDPKERKLCIDMLMKCGVKVIEKPRFHFKAVIIDDAIIYIGSINPLQIITVRYVPADYMLRFVSEALVDEIIEKFIRNIRNGYNNQINPQ